MFSKTLETPYLLEINPENTKEKYVTYENKKIVNDEYNELSRALLKQVGEEDKDRLIRIYNSLKRGSILLDYKRAEEELKKLKEERDYYLTMQMLAHIRKISLSKF